MRAFINAVLTFIGAESLTDEEFSALTITSAGYNKETYEAIAVVLEGREAVSTFQDRLKYVFLAKGVEITTPHDTGKSNIFAGAVL